MARVSIAHFHAAWGELAAQAMNAARYDVCYLSLDKVSRYRCDAGGHAASERV